MKPLKRPYVTSFLRALNSLATSNHPSSALRAPAWHLLTGEYPPQPGGVGEYARLVAHGLAREGEEVHVWAPAPVEDGGAEARVEVHPLRGRFDRRSLHDLERGLERCAGPRLLLVQYVPHAFGFRAMNLGFCRWLGAASARERIWVMFHEVCFPWTVGWRPLRHNLLAAVTRLMARRVARAAERIFVSIPHWGALLGSLARLERAPEWLPVPSNVATDVAPLRREAARARIAPAGGPVIGHFGTFGDAIGGALEGPLLRVLRDDPRRVGLLLGRGGDRCAERLRRENPDLAARLVGPGALPSDDLAAHLAACDVLLQPYPEGATTRRGSLMAGLALGVPAIANAGSQTEPLWAETGAVSLVSGQPQEWAAATARLLADPPGRAALGARGRRLYEERFSLGHTIRTLIGERRQ